VVIIGAGSDYRKQAQFKSLSDYGKGFKTVKVWRDGEVLELQYDLILVGDVIEVQTGLVVPSDGVLFSGFNVEADESTMTGEPQAIRKDLEKDPFLISGTSVVNGVGKMMVIATGVNSLNGRSLMALEVEAEDTPLQVKLGRLADLIAKFAFYLSSSLIILLVVLYFALGRRGDAVTVASAMLNILILAVTIVVVAVPEGLPLAVTISLANATLEMLKDNNLVRHLAACETMGIFVTCASSLFLTLSFSLNR
jgi:Ca2+-transporting ATPase